MENIIRFGSVCEHGLVKALCEKCAKKEDMELTKDEVLKIQDDYTGYEFLETSRHLITLCSDWLKQNEEIIDLKIKCKELELEIKQLHQDNAGIDI